MMGQKTGHGTRSGCLRRLVMMVGVWAGVGTAQAQTIEAQQEAFSLANELINSIRDAFEDGDVRTGYAEAIGVVRGVAEAYEGEGAWDILSQMVASAAAGVGMHELALEAMAGTGAERSAPEGMEVEDAIEAIVRESAGRRVVMLNEAHHVGMHREFARRLLRPLRDAGFTHLACEGFANSDEEGFAVNAMALGYATRETGHYIADPFFADLVREAVELGFELVAYETLDVRPPGEESPATSINRREISQAQQLAAVLEADPNARVFVYCGYSHLTESPIQVEGEETRWMANRLAAMCGIDPLTVSQTTYYPRSTKGKAGIAGYSADDAFVLRGEEGLWSANPGQYDIELLHPRTARVDGRAGWVFRADDRERVVVDLPEDGDAVVVVTRAGEAMDAVPSDVVEVHRGQELVSLSLRKGVYRVWLVRTGAEPELVASLAVE